MHVKISNKYKHQSLVQLILNMGTHTIVLIYSLQNKCRTADPDRQNSGRSGKLSFFVIYKFWQNCASVWQVSDLILKTGYNFSFFLYQVVQWYVCVTEVSPSSTMNASSVSATSLVPPQPAPAGLLIPTSAFQAIKPAPAPAPVGAVSGNNAVPLSQLTLPAANQGEVL